MEYWHEVLGSGGVQLEAPRPLTSAEVESLWHLFSAIPTHWSVPFNPNLLRSRWNDMLEARSGPPVDRRSAFINAAAVFEALRQAQAVDPLKLVFVDTIITKELPGLTRLQHAKLFVVNDFIRCFVAMGGFRAFVPEGRNYGAFLGGSRFREWAPVRTGVRK